MPNLKRFECHGCGRVDLVSGGTCNYHCGDCRRVKGLPNLGSLKYLAHQAVAKARASGLLADPKHLHCDDCGAPAIEYDHRDYTKPLEVVAVCRRCNLRRGPAIGSTALCARANPLRPA